MVAFLSVTCRMDLTPTIVKVKSEDALKSKCEEYAKEGRKIINCNILEDGIVGRLAFLEPPAGKKPEEWTHSETDAHWIVWEKYGQVLVPERIQVNSGNELFALYNEHSGHNLIGFTNSETKTAGFVCFCQANEEKSIVFTVDVSNIKEVPPDLLAAMKK